MKWSERAEILKLEIQKFIENYFRLETDETVLVNRWATNKYFLKFFEDVNGIRLLRQEPFECIISFICSQNNNIKRIRKMVLFLQEEYGCCSDNNDDGKCKAFPAPLDFNKPGFLDKMVANGFGYRAKYINTFVEFCIKNNIHEPKDFFKYFGSEYAEITQNLKSLMGVGSKVADCIALFAFNQTHIVPLDTHILKLTDLLKMKAEAKTKLSSKKHLLIQKAYVDVFGIYAGWAHLFFFAKLVRKELPAS